MVWKRPDRLRGQSGGVGTNSSSVSPGVVSISSDRREASVWDSARGAAQQFQLGGFSGRGFVDLWMGGKVASLLGECPGAPTTGRWLALHDVLLGCLPGSKRAVRLDCVFVAVSRA